MKTFALLAAAAACALAGAAVAQPAPPPPYNDTPASYPWRNGVIDGPGGPGPYGGGPGPYGGGGGYGGGGYAYGGYGAAGGYGGGGGYGGYGGGYGGGGVVPPGGGPVVFPLPDNGAYAVGVNSDGSLQVVRYGPVWTNEVGPNGWSHRRYIRYGFPFSGIWPFN
jgi:hypothetical protein